MPTPKLISHLTGKPVFPILYESAAQQYGKQVRSILDQIAVSKSPAAAQIVENPSKNIKWELIFERGDDPDDLSDYDAILARLTATSKVYLKATGAATGGSGGRVMKVEQVSSIPDRILAIIEQRAKLLARQYEHSLESPVVSVGDPSGNGVSLLSYLESWYEKHPTANRRLYYVARDILKNLMESTGDSRR